MILVRMLPCRGYSLGGFNGAHTVKVTIGALFEGVPFIRVDVSLIENTTSENVGPKPRQPEPPSGALPAGGGLVRPR